MKPGLTVLFAAALLVSAPVSAQNTNQNGQVGGLHLPTARTLEAGSGYAGFGYGEFDRYGFLGLQPTEDLRLTLRQNKDTYNYTYPGLDAQIQLLPEGDWQPETALGFTHLLGQGRYAGEYLVFSKRVEGFDFGLGLGWGRYAQRGAFDNSISNHNAARDSGAGKDGPDAWFQGHDMGVFASVAYQTPIDPLQLVAEYDPDPYFQERTQTHYFNQSKITRRAPVNVGARVTLIPGLALTASLNALSQPQFYVTYALNFQKENPETWQFGYETHMRPAPIPDDGVRRVDFATMQTLAWRDGAALQKITAPQPGEISARFAAGTVQPYAASLGQAAYAIAENTGEDVVAITLTPENQGLVGDRYMLLRRDVVRQTQFRGSVAEVRQNARILPALDDVGESHATARRNAWLRTTQRVDLDPFEYGSFLLNRTRVMLGGGAEAAHGITLGMTGSARVSDNFPTIPPTAHPARSRINDYASRDFGIENMYMNGMHTFLSGLHARVTAGMLEEMYRGVSGEILYQPFRLPWAVGAEGNWLQQRSSTDDFARTNFTTMPASLSVYYEILPRNLTVIARAEQFLARDKGGTLELQHEFLRGARLGFAFSWSDKTDFGGLNDKGRTAAMMTLRVPLSYAFANFPVQNQLDMRLAPTARDSGQRVEVPVRLWDATRPISYGTISESWGDFLNF